MYHLKLVFWPDDTRCPFEQDATWNITWPASEVNVVATQKCPGGSEAEGMYVKYCLITYLIVQKFDSRKVWWILILTDNSSILSMLTFNVSSMKPSSYFYLSKFLVCFIHQDFFQLKFYSMVLHQIKLNVKKHSWRSITQSSYITTLEEYISVFMYICSYLCSN